MQTVEYQLRSPGGRIIMATDQEEHAQNRRAQMIARSGAALRLFEVRREEREIAA